MHLALEIVRYMLAAAALVLAARIVNWQLHWREYSPFPRLSESGTRSFLFLVNAAGFMVMVGLSVALVVNELLGYGLWSGAVIAIFVFTFSVYESLIKEAPEQDQSAGDDQGEDSGQP